MIDEIRKHCPASNVFCVGDDWQAINGFAGADLKYFNSFKDKYDDSVELPLRTNYRSDKLIVDVGNPIIGKMEKIKSDVSQCKIWTGGKKVVILQCF